MNDVSEPDTCVTEPLPAAGGFSDNQPVAVSKWYRWRKRGVAIADYLLDAEVHTFAFSVAANAIISFIPLIVLLYTIALSVFHSQEMVTVVNKIVEEFLPTTAKQGSEDFLAFWLRWAAQTSGRHGVQALSLVMILISCTGIFLPLEVALNQAWGVTKSRNYLWNQVVAFGLAIWMVFLAMASVLLSTWQRQLLGFVFFHHTENFVFQGISYLWLAATTGVASVLFFFSIYWLSAQSKDSGAPGHSHFDHHGSRLAGREGRFRRRAAAPRSEGSVWTVLRFRRSVVLGLHLRADPLRRCADQRDSSYGEACKELNSVQRFSGCIIVAILI